MAVMLDIDPHRADSRRAQAEMIGGPLAAGYELTALAMVNGAATLTEPASEVSILARLLRDLGNQELVVTTTLTDDSTAQTVILTFERYSTTGTGLLLRRRDLIDGVRLAIAITATLDGAAVDPADLDDWLALDLMRGHMAHVSTLLAFEHQRLRRHLAAALAARTIPGAEGGLLDRIGSELGVPRLDSRFVFTAGTLSSIVADTEADAAYRARMAPYRAHVFPTPGAVRAALRTIDSAFDIEERTMGFEGAFRLVAFADTAANATAMRTAAFAHLRDSVLINPGDTSAAPANASAAVIARTALRDRLRAAFGVAANASVAIAPALARALDRLAELFAGIGYGGPVVLVQGQTDAGGARYELGLGARLQVPATFLADLDAAIVAADASQLGAYERGVAALHALAPAERAQLDQLLGVVGFSTTLQLDDTNLYVSHLRTGSMEIDGNAAVDLPAQGNASTTLTARELVPTSQMALAQALSEAASTAAVTGAAMAGNAILPLMAGLVAHDASYRDRILPPRFSLADQTALGASLAMADPALIAGLQIDAADAAQLVAGDAGSWDALLNLSFALADLGIPAMAVVVTPAQEVIIIASSAPLPSLGANLTLRRTLARRWGTADLSTGTGGAFGSDSAETYTISASTPGLWCVALMSYRRLDQPDPMEIRPALPLGTEIDYTAYERMMNLLLLLRPLGVAVNSWRIRQRHVRLDPAAPQAALNLSAARSFRRYRQDRFARPIAPSTPGDSNG